MTIRLSLAAFILLLIFLSPARPCQRANAALPPAGASPVGPGATSGKLPVLLVKGMWSEHWKLDEALSDPPGRYAASSAYVTQRFNYVFALKYFPEKMPDLLSEKVVVLANVPTTALLRQGPMSAMKPAEGRSDQWLVDFVQQGGGLLVMGGSFSFDLENTIRQPGKTPLQNTFKDSALAGILPVELARKEMSFDTQNKPLEITPASPHPILKGLLFQEHPITLFYHPMILKKDAVVVLQAGGAPILVVGTYGKGRVAVFLATLHGDPPPSLKPYWEWASWPMLMRNTINWLSTE